jgi:DNA-binding CsgD family transcriptional regulator
MAGTSAGPDAHWREYAAGLCDAAVMLLADLYEGLSSEAVTQCAMTERMARLQFAMDETKLGFILALQVLIYSRHSSVAEARRTLEDYVALVERNGFGPQHPSVHPQRGLLAFLEGDVETALEYLSRQSPRRIERFAEPEPLLAQLSGVLVAAIHYGRNEVEKAYQIVDRVGVDPDRTFPETWALCSRIRALCLHALGREREAGHGLAEESERMKRREAARFGLIIEATQLELALRTQSPEPGEVERLARALDSELNRLDASWLFIAALAPGVVLGLLATGQAERGRRLAERWMQRSSACGHGPFRATGHLLAARAAEAVGDESGALSEIMRALSLTAPGRLVRPYLDVLVHPPAMLLRALGQLSSAGTVEHLRAVLRSCGGLETQASGWTMLSERERDVLWALSAHASTKAIAKHLGVSPETVKHHLKRIFAKLGVHSRDEALRRVAQLAE